MITENEYAHWLFTSPGLGKRKIEKILCTGISCKGLYHMPDAQIRALIKGKTAEELIKHRKNWDFDREKEKLGEQGISAPGYGWSSGIDTGFYPSPKVYMAGVSIKF